MKARELVVSYFEGKPLAAYLHLMSGPELKSAWTEQVHGRIVVDYGSDGAPIGVEIINPGHTSLEEINGVLRRLQQPSLTPEEFEPLSPLHVSRRSS